MSTFFDALHEKLPFIEEAAAMDCVLRNLVDGIQDQRWSLLLMTLNLSEEVIIEIPFHDVDAMGVVWHGHYVKYMEIARTAMLRKIGLDVPQLRDTGFGWFVAECHMKYIRPLLYGMKICVKATLLEYENRVKVGYLMTDAVTGERLNKAWTTHLAVNIKTGELVLDLPPIFDAEPKS